METRIFNAEAQRGRRFAEKKWGGKKREPEVPSTGVPEYGTGRTGLETGRTGLETGRTGLETGRTGEKERRGWRRGFTRQAERLPSNGRGLRPNGDGWDSRPYLVLDFECSLGACLRRRSFLFAILPSCP